MNFVSLEFVAFLLCTLFCYYLIPKKHRWVVLLVGSYVFYMASSVKLTVFLLLTTVTTFFAGKKLGQLNEETAAYLAEHKQELDREAKKQYKAQQTVRKRWVVLLAVLWNIGTLCVLKYTGFVFNIINSVLSMTGLSWNLPGVSFLLPLGISFYTFQAVGYVIDVYRGKYQADDSLPQYMLFLSFFPQIIQGPIARHDHLAHQLYEGHAFDYDQFTKGLQLILWGLIKKLVVAERLALIVDHIFGNYLDYAGLTFLVAAVLYGMQIYMDFSGGIDMTRGIGQLFGIDMAVNFERPYFAKSLSEFWRRWHMTLGGWMKDYVFYPLSLSKAANKLGKKTRKWFGNQTGKMIPTFLAMFVTFMLVGIWHGAETKYIAYGFWNAGIISSSILLEPVYKKMAAFCHINTQSKGWQLFSMLRTFLICSIGRFFPRCDSLRMALVMIKSSFTVWNPEIFTNGTFSNIGLTNKDWKLLGLMMIVLLIVGIVQERGVKIRDRVAAMPIPVRWSFYIAAFLLLALCGMYGPGYSAASFVYQQF